MKFKSFFFLALAIGVGIGIYSYATSGPLTVTDCMDKDYISVQVTGGKPIFALDPGTSSSNPPIANNNYSNESDSVDTGSLGTSTHVRVTISLTSSAPQNLSITIPCGMIINNSTPGGVGQRLIVAKTVVIVMGSHTTLSTNVETYCLDELALDPTPNSSLSFQSMTYYQTSGPEQNRVRQFVEYLQNKEVLYKDRQAALWLLGGTFLNCSPTQVYDSLFKYFHDELNSEISDKWQSLKGLYKKQWQEQNPNLNDAEVSSYVNQGFEEYDQKLDGTLSANARKQAQAELDLFRTSGRRLLLEWDPSLSDSAFFQN